MWVIDSADARRVADTAQELARLLQEERLASAALLILANKQDVAGAASPAELQRALDLSGLRNRSWRISGCSAVRGEGVDDAFAWVVRDVGERLYLLD